MTGLRKGQGCIRREEGGRGSGTRLCTHLHCTFDYTLDERHRQIAIRDSDTLAQCPGDSQGVQWYDAAECCCGQAGCHRHEVKGGGMAQRPRGGGGGWHKASGGGGFGAGIVSPGKFPKGEIFAPPLHVPKLALPHAHTALPKPPDFARGQFRRLL